MRSKDYTQQACVEHANLSGYSVMVRGLPLDATEEDIIDHFSDLFRLDRDSWSQPGHYGIRRKVADRRDDILDAKGNRIGHFLKPVQSTAHSPHDFLCMGKWVAEAVVAHKERSFITAASGMRKISRDLIILRAKIKKYSPGSKFQDAKKAALLELRLQQLMANLDKRTSKIALQALEYQANSWECCAAFLIFNHEESFRRCVEDYANFGGQLEPKPLRFKGEHILDVRRAPEPSSILWENLEIGKYQRRARILGTYLATLLVLICSFTVVSAAIRAKNIYNSAMPSDEVCYNAVPVARGIPSNNFYHYSILNSTMLEEYSLQDCTVDGDKFVIVDSEDLTQTANFNSSQDPCQQHCVSVDDSAVCEVPALGLSFTGQDVLNCYCRQLIAESILLMGRTGAVLNVLRTANPQCGQAALLYMTGEGFAVIASLLLIAVNLLVRSLLSYMTKHEGHATISVEATSTAGKLAAALFANTFIVTMLAYANVQDPAAISQKDGPVDFTVNWYVKIGASVTLTIIVNMISPHGGPVLGYLIVAPIQRAIARRTAVTQDQMNKAYEGQLFDLNIRLPFVINTLAISFLLSSALPLLLPLATIGFGLTYCIDKFFVLRWYTRPPQIDCQLMNLVTKLSSAIAFSHCVIAIWVYSEPTVFDVQLLGPSNRHGHQWTNRYLTTNCIPFVILGIMLALNYIFLHFSTRFFLIPIRKFLMARTGVVAPESCVARAYSPEFTGNLVWVFPKGKIAPPKKGWDLTTDQDGHQVLRKLKKSKAGGTREMMTWEVLKEVTGVSSYHMADSPAYKYIVDTRNLMAEALDIELPDGGGGRSSTFWDNAVSKALLLNGCNTQGGSISTNASSRSRSSVTPMSMFGGNSNKRVSDIPTNTRVLRSSDVKGSAEIREPQRTMSVAEESNEEHEKEQVDATFEGKKVLIIPAGEGDSDEEHDNSCFDEKISLVGTFELDKVLSVLHSREESEDENGEKDDL